MSKELIKLCMMCLCSFSIVVATDQQLAQEEGLVCSELSDAHFVEALKHIEPLQMNDRSELNLQVGQKITVGSYQLLCTMSTSNDMKEKGFRKLYKDKSISSDDMKEQGFKIFYKDKSILKLNVDHVIYFSDTFLMETFYKSFGDLLGPIVYWRNFEQIEKEHRSNVLAIFKRLLLRYQITYENFLDNTLFEQSGFVSIFDGVETMVAPSFGNLVFNKFSTSKYGESLEEIYPDGLWPVGIRSKYFPIFDHVHKFLGGIEKQLQTYQWCMLVEMMVRQISKDTSSYDLYRKFTHETLYILQELGHFVDLEGGGINTFEVPEYTQNGKIFPAKQVSFYAKGGWCLGCKGYEPAAMPDFFIDVRNKMNVGQYVYQKHCTPNGEKHIIVSDKGIEEDGFLLVKTEGDKTVVYHLSGLKSENPFSILQKQELDASVAIEETIIPYPNDEKDLDVLSYLLSEMNRQEAKEEIEEQIKNIQKTEELPDDGMSEEDKVDFVTKQRLRREENLIQMQQEQKRREEMQRQKEVQLKEETIKKIEDELLKKEDYDSKVRREQEARTRQVIKEAQKTAGKNQGKKSASSSPKSTNHQRFSGSVAEETTEQMRIRVRLKAETIFEERRVKMKDIAERINRLLKIIPEARSILFRQSGSHLVADGVGEESGPVTFVIPHSGDGTISRISVNDFFGRFVNLLAMIKSK